MFIVAVTDWAPGKIGPNLPALAKHLDVFPYDLRMRLNGTVPVVVTRDSDLARANALTELLRSWGHQVVCCDAADIFRAAHMDQPRSFRFVGQTLQIEDAAHEDTLVQSGDVGALIHVMTLADHRQTQTRTAKRFSATKAVLSGGLMVTSNANSTSTVTQSDAEERIYMIREGASSLLWCQHALHYGGLGDEMGRSSHESFARLTARLRAWAPHAVYDQRLRQTRRKGSLDAVVKAKAGKVAMTTATTSNASAVDLAAYLIWCARLMPAPT